MTPHPRAPRQVDRRGRSARLLLAAPLAVLTLAVGACAPSADSSSGSTADGGQTLTVWSWRTEDVDAYNQIFDVFEKAHPGVTVNFRAFKNTEYNQVLTTGLTGSGGPDVAQVRSYGLLQPNVAAKQLVPLDAHVELVRQTRSLAFLQGVVKQDGAACYSFSGTLKKLRETT